MIISSCAGLIPRFAHATGREKHEAVIIKKVQQDISHNPNHWSARELLTIFLFSNKIADMSFRTLLQGKVQTTLGTDFNCTAKHIIEHDYNKIIVITDGYASMNLVNSEKLERAHLQTLTTLFGGKTDCPEFQSFGDVLQLTDITN